MGQCSRVGGFGREHGRRIGDLSARARDGGLGAFLGIGDLAWFGSVLFVGMVEMVTADVNVLRF